VSRIALRRFALGAALLGVLGLRVAAVFTESLNWDEFALAERAANALASGELRTGGRPGLAVLALLPFVGECEDEVAILRAARLAWVVVTAALVAGVFALLVRAQGAAPRRFSNAALGTALLALVPEFLRWSLHVRSDQLALAAGAWAGVALLASRERLAWALGAGALLGIGYLATQKLLYAAGLVGVLVLADLRFGRDLVVRREALRAALCAGAFAAVVAGFALVVGRLFAWQGVVQASRMGDVFAFYRETLGFAQYRAMAPHLVPHLLLLGALALATVRLPARRRELCAAWAALALGLAVALFHSAAFFYFWMTLGLFPAVAVALGADAIREALAPRARTALFAAVWLLLAAGAALESARMLRDTQAVQVASFAFVRRNFARTDSGFQPERALFCQRDAEPFPTFFSQLIAQRFSGEQARANGFALIESFRAKPVKFLVGSWRLAQFPRPIQRFWIENYQPYHASVHVAGRRIAGAAGAAVDFEIVVPGTYRWEPRTAPATVEIDGAALAPGATLDLAAGPHRAVLGAPLEHGLLVLAVEPAYAPASGPFYRGWL
jgi:hypothetical protein